MKMFLMIAGAALTFGAGLTASAADAQNQRQAPGYAQDGYGRDGNDRDRRYNRRQNAQQIRYWRDDLGRRCYRRSDGVRRCETVSQRREDRPRRYR